MKSEDIVKRDCGLEELLEKVEFVKSGSEFEIGDKKNEKLAYSRKWQGVIAQRLKTGLVTGVSEK